MLVPPSVVRVVLVRRGRKVLGLWLPVILIWPPVAALAVVAFALAVPIAAVLWRTGYGRTILWSVPCLLGLLAAARGLEVDVAGGGSRIVVRCI